MKLNLTLFATSTLLGTAVSHPSNLTSRIQARSLNRQSRPNIPAPGGHPGSQSGFRTAETAAIAYSNNWSGAAREKPLAGGSAAILQTGVDFYVENGQVHSDAWFEWFPDFAYDFDLAVKTGDVIVARVESSSPSEGIAVIENKSTGQTATQTVRAPKPEATLAGQNAEWIVEDFQSGGSVVALADFGRVTFTGCEAEASNGETAGLDGATIIELKQEEKVLTKVAILGDDTLTVNQL